MNTLTEKLKLASEIRRVTRAADTLAGGTYPQSEVWIRCVRIEAGNYDVSKQMGPPGNAYRPDTGEAFVRFSLDADDCVRYPSGPHSGREAKGRDAVAILADYAADAILEKLEAK